MLVCVTANHLNSPFEMLEQLSVESEATAAAIAAHPQVAGAVVLATCNRFEAYLDIDATGDPSTAAIDLVSGSSSLAPAALRRYLDVLTEHRVVEHLFAVSTGLESVIVGEDEISGQVRRSLEQARRDGTISSRLDLLFQNASRTSRQVRDATPLGGAGRSLVRLAFELAASRVPDWRSQRTLLVGTGQYARTTVAALRERGVEDISVYSPSGRGSAFALRHGLGHATALEQACADADLIVTCTSSNTPVITSNTFASAAPGYRLVIDLGLPRNVAAEVAAMEGIELLDLKTIQVHAPLDELTAQDDARALVGNAVSTFAEIESERSVAPAIVALRSQVFAVLDEEIGRIRTHGDDGGHIESALRHLVGVLLHTPSSRAHELAREGRAQDFVDGIEAVFGIRSSLSQQPAPEQGEECA